MAGLIGTTIFVFLIFPVLVELLAGSINMFLMFLDLQLVRLDMPQLFQIKLWQAHKVEYAILTVASGILMVVG